MQTSFAQKQSLVHKRVGDFVLDVVRYEPNQFIAEHTHESAFVSMALEGAYSERLDGRTIQYHSNTIVVRPGRYGHVNSVGSMGSKVLLIEILRTAEEHINAHGITLSAPKISEHKLPGQMARRLYRTLTRASSLYTEGLILEILAELLCVLPESRIKNGRWMSRVMPFLKTNFTRPITLDEIAAVGGIHPVHLSRSFTKLEGCTLGQFMRRLRIDEGCSYLIATSLTVTEIAMRTGFSDHSHFCRVFHEQMGISPGEFRRRHRGTKIQLSESALNTPRFSGEAHHASQESPES